jgi:hypothetical protein
MPIRREVDHDFFKTWSPQMAYVLGFFAADGTMIVNKRGAHFIEFHITDLNILRDIRELLKSNHKIGIRTRDPKWKIGYRIQIGSKELFRDLQLLGFTPNKSKNMKLPAVPNKVWGDFVCGYFDGDGCVYFRKHRVNDRPNSRWVFSTRFTAGCRNFLEVFHARLKKTGLSKGFIVPKTRGYELVFSHGDSVALFRLMYHNAGTRPYLPRKYRKYQKALITLYGQDEFERMRV